MKPSPINNAGHSFLSAASGLVAGAVTSVFAFPPSTGSRIDLPLYFILGLLSGAPLMLAAWLFVLWPVFVFTPATSGLWRPEICIPLGAFAGAILPQLFLGVVFPSSALLLPGQLLVGAITGGVTSVFAWSFKHL